MGMTIDAHPEMTAMALEPRFSTRFFLGEIGLIRLLEKHGGKSGRRRWENSDA